MPEEITSASKTRQTRATKKVAESTPIENVVIEQMDNNSVNDDGQQVITGPKKVKPTRVSNMHSKEDVGVVASRAADRKAPRVAESKDDEKKKVALWSEKNIRWSEVGTLSKGYNIVAKEAAEKWLSRDGIRKATPKEVAAYYGKE